MPPPAGRWHLPCSFRRVVRLAFPIRNGKRSPGNECSTDSTRLSQARSRAGDEARYHHEQLGECRDARLQEKRDFVPFQTELPQSQPIGPRPAGPRRPPLRRSGRKLHRFFSGIGRLHGESARCSPPGGWIPGRAVARRSPIHTPGKPQARHGGQPGDAGGHGVLGGGGPINLQEAIDNAFRSKIDAKAGP